MKDKTTSTHLNRREFVKIVTTFLGSIMGAVTGIPIIGYIISPAMRVQEVDDWIPLGPLEDYLIGIPTFFSFTRTRTNGWENTINSYGVYILRKSQHDLRVFSDICTHLACRVKWRENIQEYVSPCHDGHFDIDGYVTKGPPPRALDQFEYTLVDGNLFIHIT